VANPRLMVFAKASPKVALCISSQGAFDFKGAMRIRVQERQRLEGTACISTAWCRVPILRGVGGSASAVRLCGCCSCFRGGHVCVRGHMLEGEESAGVNSCL